MNIHTATPKTKQRRWKKKLVCGLVIVVLIAYGLIAVTRPLNALAPSQSSLQLHSTPQTSLLSWPVSTQAAVGVVGTTIFSTHGEQKALPTASTAKVLAALSILKQKPLNVGQQGPDITLGASDVAIYQNYVAQQGSVVPVTAGEQITEYQALEAMLLPSANNIADSLAIWAFGSLSAYATYANSYAQQLGLTATHIGVDASGFDPSTVSTAGDLVKLGEAAMQNPVIAQIVARPSATGIPNTDSVKNVNFLLGSDGVIGIKTGNTDQAGGVFISASQTVVGGHTFTIVTALIGAPDLYSALSFSEPLIVSAQKNFTSVTVVQSGTIVGQYTTKWGQVIPAVASQTINSLTWRDTPATATATLTPVSAKAQKGQIAGTITLPASQTSPTQSSAITLQANVSKPSLLWRLLHPLG